VTFLTKLGVLEGTGMDLSIVPTQNKYKAKLFFAHLYTLKKNEKFTLEFVVGNKTTWTKNDPEFKLAKKLVSQLLIPNYFKVDDLISDVYTKLGKEALLAYHSYRFK
jgi:hypothetical protein